MHIDELITSIRPLNPVVQDNAQKRWDQLIKPHGSLGKLEKAVKMSEETYCGVEALFRKAIEVTSEIRVKEG